ncbi:CLUMA_CG008375, isoform A [Clunio marinus]|uniref:CLUMA_CG008375, isoform A n=1 Tax=Clunio marinus TaxID=568069 RepID=A0A1J1I3W1_9DIPT|nr:CLUMA_CG008375, isoform A [Clunio marinus]
MDENFHFIAVGLTQICAKDEKENSPTHTRKTHLAFFHSASVLLFQHLMKQECDELHHQLNHLICEAISTLPNGIFGSGLI